MLHVQRVALECVRRLAPIVDAIARKDTDLARQLRRSASSIVLNIAEAQGSRDGNSRLRYRTALGSTRETTAALEVATAWGYAPADETLAARLDEVARMLFRLSR